MKASVLPLAQIASLLCALALLITVGCGRPEYALAPVSGRVTLDSSPVADAQITFQPIADAAANKITVGPGSYGRTDGDGRFTLKTFDNDRPGAVVGDHVVTITKEQINVGLDTDEIQPVAIHGRLPPKAHNGTLRMTIRSGGMESADFEFTTDGA